MAEDDVPGNTNHSGIIRHIAQHHRSGADTAVLANNDVAKHLRSSANHDVVADGRMTFAGFLARAAEGHALIERYVISDDSGFADDDTHSVIDEEAAPDLRAGMD